MSEFWIQTFTGKKFDYVEPTLDMIDIIDIAHQLSIENRFAGATKYAYSVGYHAINSCNMSPDFCRLESLLDDAEEAYTKDLPSPLKWLIRSKSSVYDDIVNPIKELIINRFKLEIAHKETVKIIDLRMAITERNQLCVTPPENWKLEWEDSQPFNIDIMKLQPENVEELFLKEYNKWKRA